MNSQTFIARWKPSGGSERANYSLFLSELCDLLGVQRPMPAGAGSTDYVFERAVEIFDDTGHKTSGFIDLYKRGCFVLEAKQGADSDPARLAELTQREAAAAKRRLGHGKRGSAVWDDAMLSARRQALRYAGALPVDEGWPPFIVVVDVGFSIELFADFARTGKRYTPFPDSRSYRVWIDDLEHEPVRARLRAVFEDPMSLDPSRVAAAVTRQVADPIADLARELEGAGHEPAAVADFLMRSLFTMFAEDVGLLPAESFTGLLHASMQHPEGFVHMVGDLWRMMDEGGFATVIHRPIPRFNGYLFKRRDVLPLRKPQIEKLLAAAKADWRAVEPAIFGTLLERALDARERHKLGAHYTPRAYVERLVFPTVIDPLRADWDVVSARAVDLANAGDVAGAEAAIRAFHQQLCATRVLDPACGTGNFLYVTMEHMKRLEGEVLNLRSEITGDTQELLGFTEQTVDPHQFLGIELNPRAAAIAELVLWIGYLQWHFRTRGAVNPPEPILRAFSNIQNRDAILAWDTIEPRVDASGQPVTRWDGVTTKKHPVTGADVPDEAAQVAVYDFINPRKAEWPDAEFIVGNPPFLGKLRIVSELGEGYAEALRATYAGEVPDSADFVMYWWARAADCVVSDSVRAFGLITTNSITQAFNRRIIESALAKGLLLRFAIPDHPWVDTASGAAVRIAMTVVGRGGAGTLARVTSESSVGGDGGARVTISERVGEIQADLTVGANVSGARQLMEGFALASMGPALGSRGFVVSGDIARRWFSLHAEVAPRIVRRVHGARDLLYGLQDEYCIDAHDLEEAELAALLPEAYQQIRLGVYPERATNRDAKLRREWWRFRRSNEDYRSATRLLERYIATPETSKHRVFVMVLGKDLVEHGTIAIALSDAYHLGVLSSAVHVKWALAAGGRLGVGNDPRYNKTRCFDPFPFPAATEAQQARIRELGEQLDAHRKARQAAHPGLTMTGMYNVLEALREGRALTAKEKKIHDEGLVGVLLHIHTELDRAVLDAYGWPPDLTDDALLERLVALNAERAAEEAAGHIRWLRPDYQRPLWAARQKKGSKRAAAGDGDEEGGGEGEGDGEGGGEGGGEGAAPARVPWPARLREKLAVARAIVAELGSVAPGAHDAATAEAVLARVDGATLADVAEVLEALGDG